MHFVKILIIHLRRPTCDTVTTCRAHRTESPESDFMFRRFSICRIIRIHYNLMIQSFIPKKQAEYLTGHHEPAFPAVCNTQEMNALNRDKNKQNPNDYMEVCCYHCRVGHQRLFFLHDEACSGYLCHDHAGMSHNRLQEREAQQKLYSS